MDTYLLELIERMNDNRDQHSSSSHERVKTTSWKATREAEKLTVDKFIPELMRFIENEVDKRKRDKAYFILGKIAKNTGNTDVAQFLINRIGKEKDKNILSFMLMYLADLEKPEGTDLEPLINVIQNSKHSVRNHGILALNKTNNEQAEDTLILIASTSRDQFELSYACGTLAHIGTVKSVPILLELINHNKEKVASHAFWAITRICKEEQLSLYRKKVRQGKVKPGATLAVIDYGNEKDIPLIIARIKQIVSRNRGSIVFSDRKKSELMIALEFVKNAKSYSPHYFELLCRTLVKHEDYLSKTDLRWIEEERKAILSSGR